MRQSRDSGLCLKTLNLTCVLGQTRVSAPKVVGLLVRTTWAGARTLRDARVVYLAANYIVGIALLEPLQARLTARR